MTKLVRNGRHTRRISNEKHASNINIHRNIENVPHGVIWQSEAIGIFPADEVGIMYHCLVYRFFRYRYEVCTGMKFVPV